MIYTVTLNPSMDYIMRCDAPVIQGEVNRSQSEQLVFGGKGVNVSRMLARMDVPSVAMGFAGGFIGRAMLDFLDNEGIVCQFIQLPEGMTRINVKVHTTCVTEINASGPAVGEREMEQFFSQLEILQNGDVLVLAGSVPSMLPSSIYSTILGQLSGKDIRVVVDAHGNTLKSILPYHPYLIKPNHIELGELFGKQLNTDEEVIECAKEVQKMGAENVLVSMSSRGCMWLDKNGQVYRMPAIQGHGVDPVGAGDSMVAGVLAALHRGGSVQDAITLGTAAGAATAFSIGLGEPGDILDNLRKLSAHHVISLMKMA